jgi:para-aminobenzoate synthetase/4-amino-4-deoxychorismate lyase
MEQSAGEIVARSADEVSGALESLDRAVADGLHVAGYFSYELGYCFEPRLRRLAPTTSRPLLRFGIFAQRTQLDARERNRWLIGLGFPDSVAIATSEAISLETYERQFSHVHDLIGQGDVYQVNLTFKVRTQPVADVSSLYQRLRTRARAGGAARGRGARTGRAWPEARPHASMHSRRTPSTLSPASAVDAAIKPAIAGGLDQ